MRLTYLPSIPHNRDMNLFDVIMSKLEHDSPVISDPVELARLAYWGRTLDSVRAPSLAASYAARAYRLRVRAAR